ncbi:MAG: hypothetical protein ABJD07_05720 [Gemmatimonadaceae bacterium]
MRRHALSAALALSGARAIAAQSAPPSTDIFLATLAVRGTTVTVGTPVNITHRDGYDNQPSFTPDGRAILYTVRADSQTDIWRYELASKAATQLTHTAESEYSATVTPDGRGFSVIRVERDSTQRLWRFAMTGEHPALVLANVKPVGYHAWADDSTLVVFVLGRPSTLQRVSVRGGEPVVLARDIGRALQRIPGQHAISFVQSDSAKGAWIERLDVATGTVTPIAPLPEGSEYHAWTRSGALLATQRATIVRWNAATKTWSIVATFADPALGKVSRIAIGPHDDMIAIVAEPGSLPP